MSDRRRYLQRLATPVVLGDGHICCCRIPELGRGQVRAEQVGAAQVGLAQVTAGEVSEPKVAPLEVEPTPDLAPRLLFPELSDLRGGGLGGHEPRVADRKVSPHVERRGWRFEQKIGQAIIDAGWRTDERHGQPHAFEVAPDQQWPTGLAPLVLDRRGGGAASFVRQRVVFAWIARPCRHWRGQLRDRRDERDEDDCDEADRQKTGVPAETTRKAQGLVPCPGGQSLDQDDRRRRTLLPPEVTCLGQGAAQRLDPTARQRALLVGLVGPRRRRRRPDDPRPQEPDHQAGQQRSPRDANR